MEYGVYIGIMEKKMETSIVGFGFLGLWDVGFRVQGLGFRVEVLGFRD